VLADFFFKQRKLSILLDGSAGSSGKGRTGSWITENSQNWQFCTNTFAPQAGHWVKLQNGKQYFYQTLNSCAYQEHYEKMYLAPGAMIELPALWRELEENNIKPHKLGIHPLTQILQDIDAKFERGQVDLDGNELENIHDGTMRAGTTAHGVGACRARRILRRKEAKFARDIPELNEFICDTSKEIMDRLESGQAGFMEIAQGYQLSYMLSQFYPYCTSRNCTVAAAMDDSMLPVHLAGNVMINFRSYPIRINSKKYISLKDGHHLTWQEIQNGTEGTDYKIINSPSGHGYPDQEETTWEHVTETSGSKEPILEMTSVTKLPRRVFTFSKQNVEDAIRANRANGEVYCSLNFIDYIDSKLAGKNGIDKTTSKTQEWIDNNFPQKHRLALLGTGPHTEDTIIRLRDTILP